MIVGVQRNFFLDRKTIIVFVTLEKKSNLIAVKISMKLKQMSNEANATIMGILLDQDFIHIFIY